MIRSQLRTLAVRTLAVLATIVSTVALSGCSLGQVNSAADQLKKLATALPQDASSGAGLGSAKLIYSGDKNGKGQGASTHYWGSATCLISAGTLTMWETPDSERPEAASGESLIGTATDTGWDVYYTKPDDKGLYAQAESDRAMTVDGPVVHNDDGHWTISFHGLRMQNIADNDELFINGDIDCG